MAETVMVTGANRGIGLEFVRQYIARGDRVIAAVRKPSDAGALSSMGVKVVGLEASDEKSIEGLGEALRGQAIDVLINNAGVSSETKSLAACNQAALVRDFTINSISPILVTRALLPCLRVGTRRLVVSITSKLGSIAQNTGGSAYGYRASKAALNMLNMSMANELKPEGFTCVVMHPGWVKTDMGGKEAPLTPEQAVSSMIQVISGLTMKESGSFRNYDGGVLPW
jgi:NAD(P)-dependent dehydrogenase (short-subunit alcohol dehydrogenase family)